MHSDKVLHFSAEERSGLHRDNFNLLRYSLACMKSGNLLPITRGNFAATESKQAKVERLEGHDRLRNRI